jgi:tRNA dimethylallyltransferase
MQPIVICLMGPTASGKTDLSLKLSRRFNCEIVSVDSAMVYLGMDIGTAKPSLNERQEISHHLIDLCDPASPYSAAHFQGDALEAITKILAKGKTPLLIGGTMLYYKALQCGLSPLPSANETLRQHLTVEAQQFGWSVMHEKLREVDPHSAERIKPSDAQRIQRALEVYQLTGVPLSLHLQQQAKVPPFHFINIGLIPNNRTLLHEKIAKRFKIMLGAGLLAEVEQLYQRKDLHSDLPAIRSVGYRQVWQYLAGEIDYQSIQTKAIAATRQLAKRQLTWMRSWPDLTHFECMNEKLFEQVSRHLEQYLGIHI